MRYSEALSKRLFIVAALAVAIAVIFVVRKGRDGDNAGFTQWERDVITLSDSVMYVTVLPQDSTILRTPSRDFTPEQLKDPLLGTLKAKMFSTVTDPSQDGVGIAGPQVGINRRIIWVQRLDKENEPFECYLNIRIDSLYGAVSLGPEGCLSVPGKRGLVPRYESVKISYVDSGTLEPRKEEVTGYTAIIFQHECDHLDGTLYIDKADSVFVSQSWIQEREAYTYNKPSWWR